MTTYKYIPHNVCSKEFYITLGDGIVTNFIAIGGCKGNLEALGKLIQYMKIDDIIYKLKGIKCRETSCANELVTFLELYLEDRVSEFEVPTI